MKAPINDKFVCPRCGNSDPRAFGFRDGRPYCRKCLPFAGKCAEVNSKVVPEPFLKLDYSLSEEQEAISKRLVSNFVRGVDSLVYAVCGAGKTELSYGVIACALSKGLQVGFALPRRDVVIELHERIAAAFPRNKVTAVYGGHSEVLEGDIVILTTHQLFRYEKYFDLLVMDEIDAFPFKGDPTLHAFYERSVRGRTVLLTATPSKELLSAYAKPGREVLELRTRFHRHPMPVPSFAYVPSFSKTIYIGKKLKAYRKDKRPCLVFVPSKAEAERLFLFLRPFFPRGSFVHSEDPLREEKIRLFKRRKLDYLVTTSVLERGVTVEGLHVIVADADREGIYDAATLIQIAGRAGRKASCPSGEVIFLCERKTGSIDRAILEIRRSNEFLLKLS